jgi:hypothetical protein
VSDERVLLETKPSRIAEQLEFEEWFHRILGACENVDERGLLMECRQYLFNIWLKRCG